MTRPHSADNPATPADASRPPAIIGTAGHVDHGKSTLVKALTGIDPDRLAEEKARAMTIDLGFAWLALPSGREVSIVDVPGHERFIKNMLAGVGGIDLALLVVAADEGPMPQTDEHLAILDLLGVSHGAIALTKIDTVDADWLELVAEEVRDRVAGSAIGEVPIVPVSALTGQGLDELRAVLDRQLAAVPQRPEGTRPRLPIDRVFTVAGFGTVVTGTLSGGPLRIGQELRVYPRGLPTRVRGLQTHRHKAEVALPGSRTAVNLTGLAVEDVRRGDVLTLPGTLQPTQRIDARLRLLPDSPVALEQNDEIDFFTGATELPARVTLLDRERLEPGDSGWVQFRFRAPLAVLRGDRFIVRRPSPSGTIGGGEIVDAAPPRHKRFRPEVLGALETLAQGAPDEIVLQGLERGPRERKALRVGVPGLAPEHVDSAVAQLVEEGDVLVLGVAPGANPRPGDWLMTAAGWEHLVARLTRALADFHAAHPLRKGMPREEVRSRLKLTPPRLFDEAIGAAAARGLVVEEAAALRLPDFAITLDPGRQTQIDRYLAALRAAPFTPPAPAEFGIDGELAGALADLALVVFVADGIAYAPEIYDRIVRETLAVIDRDGTIALAGFRDRFGASRKYAQATLEHFDQQRITRRVGDERVRGPAAPARSPAPPSEHA